MAVNAIVLKVAYARHPSGTSISTAVIAGGGAAIIMEGLRKERTIVMK